MCDTSCPPLVSYNVLMYFIEIIVHGIRLDLDLLKTDQ